jgi:hypothetical protein
MKTIHSVSIVCLSLAAITGCGSGAGEPGEPGVAAALSAIGGTAPAPVTTSTEPEFEVFDTKALLVADDFAFDTAQRIDIDFDLESARNTEASVSICTTYAQDDIGYDINYDTCTVQSAMINGVFSHSMEVTNEYTSVIAVVWFQNPELSPIHREFTVSGPVDERTVKSVDGRRIIVWR